MATTDLNLKDAGSLPQPGPIGRLVRLGFGALCLLYVAELWDIRNNPTVSGQISFVLGSGLPFGLYFLNYVVNIGFSQSWKKMARCAKHTGACGYGLCFQRSHGRI